MLQLPLAVEAELIVASERAAPREACGLLLGRLEGAEVRVVEARSAGNLERGPTEFSLDPVAHLAAERRAAACGLSVVGVWHSHPRGAPHPSGRDLDGTPPGWCALIVSPGSTGGTRLGVWRRESAGFARLTLNRPEEPAQPPPRGSR